MPRRLRQRHMLRLARKDRLDNLIRHRLRIQRLAGKTLKQRRARVALAHEHGAHLGRLVVRDQLGGEAFVEGDGGGFGRGVVDHGGRDEVACQTGDGNDHAVVVLDHVREELMGEVVVGEGVDLEGQVDVFLGAVEDGAAARDAGIVDEDGWVAERGADFGGGRCDG